MAWVLEVSAECGPEREAAIALATYFDGLSLVLSEELVTTCYAGIRQDSEGNWWCLATPRGTSHKAAMPQLQPDGTVRSVSDERLFIEEQVKQFVDALYLHLQSSPPYRYAVIGYETEEFRSFSELLEDLDLVDFAGLVISEQLWRQTGHLEKFLPFSQGFMWQPSDWRNYYLR